MTRFSTVRERLAGAAANIVLAEKNVVFLTYVSVNLVIVRDSNNCAKFIFFGLRSFL